ncbi:hypothetical protein GQR58_016805 [Nymphon striatum]|nr:hypothetical protein GQR58_016805 [Nymphon striatum]
MAQTVTPTKRVELIHSRYSLKPILYERVYPPEYEMAHNRRFGPWVDPDYDLAPGLTQTVTPDESPYHRPYFNVFDVVRQYHKSCRRAYFKQCKEAAPKPDAVSSRQLHSEAFKTISDFINTEMIQNNKVMLVSSVQDLYEAEYCSLGGREDDIAVYSIQALTRKLKDTFEDKILLSNYTKRQGNFLYSSSMSKVDARARFHGDEVKSKLQDMIRSTALHLRSLIHAIPKWKTPMPTSVHTLKTCSPWLPEDLFLFYKTLMCGLREPTGDQNCQGMQRKVLSMSSDADNPLANIKKFDCALLPPCTKTLQNKIRRAHYVSITWGNAEASTPTDGLDPEKYGWKMENGCLVPDWFDGPVIPADLFHDKEDTDVDTGDQQAVDDAEYDDGSSTDSEWSDDSVESDSD